MLLFLVIVCGGVSIAYGGWAIRSVLASRKRGPRALFATIPLEAENLVYDFLKEHYDDPYMDWEGSEERKRLADHGFDLESADPVIADCYKRL